LHGQEARDMERKMDIFAMLEIAADGFRCPVPRS